ncbi:MAG: cell envelope integrity protein CreD [Lysobacterales bacterium]
MRFGWKVLLLGALTLVLLLPLMLLRSLVQERQQLAAAVRTEIAESSSRAQRLTGPLLMLTVQQLVRIRHKKSVNGVEKETSEDVWQTERRLLAPDQLEIDNTLGTEVRHRGIYTARLYRDAISITANFTVPPAPRLDADLRDWRIDDARLVLGTGDNRGIGQLALALDGKELSAEPGTGIAWMPEGIQLALPDERLPALAAGAHLQITGRVELAGSERIEFAPVGAETRVAIRADWPHPGFQGNHLPQSSKIDAQGFEAQWAVSRLSSRAHQLIAQCAVTEDYCPGLDSSRFAVALVDPVDRYLKTDRAMKYALLLLVLVFGAVFFIEVLKQVRVHPLQYALTGLALAIFFLLLLALSEHLDFGPAYALATSACIGLIANYMAGVLGDRRRGLAFAALLGLLFGLLFGLLQSEDYALLVGALALFAALASVMLLTRRLDWYRLAGSNHGGG